MEFRTKRRYSTNMMLCKLLDERVADELATLCDLFFFRSCLPFSFNLFKLPS